MSAPHQAPARSRVGAFLVVGAFGFVLQIALLQMLLTVWNWSYLPATVLAVEAAVLHNFLWHERWTWRDRRHLAADRLASLLRFHISNGLTSIIGNAIVTTAGVELLHVPPVIANVVAVIAISVVNYLAADRWVFTGAKVASDAASRSRTAPLSASSHSSGSQAVASASLLFSVVAVGGVLTVVAPAHVTAQPRAGTVSAWNRYVATVESAWHPSAPAPFASGDPTGETIRIDGGTINEWRGSVLLRGTTVEHLLNALQNPGLPPPAEDILDARVLQRGDDSVRVYMKLARRAIITVTYDTEHDVTFTRLGHGLATSRSVATSIREESGADRGFLWKLNSYWTYRQIGHDVRVDLLSVSLSRNVPAVARPIASPIVTRIARESTARALEALRRFGERLG